MTSNAFISQVIHDFSTPLSVVRLRVDLIRKKPERLTEHLKEIEHQVHHLETMVSDLLTLSKLDSGDITTELRVMSVNEIATRVYAAYDVLAQHKHIQLYGDFGADLAPVLADERQMERVISNLVSNAVRYTPPHGSILIKTEQVADQIKITIEDSGIGIAPEDLPLIFDNFFRADNAQQMAKDGTGLGLSIVQKIVQQHFGTVEVQSKPGVGSQFTISLQAWRTKL